MVNRYNQIPAQVGNSEEVMAITIRDEYMNGECTDAQVCKADVSASTSDVVSTPRAAVDVPFHRHCQKTVCSAYSYNGTGKTWDVIYSQRSNLPNLPTNWISYFTRNDENITQDLEAILELINAIAGRHAQFTIQFKDSTGRNIGTPEVFDPGFEQNSAHQFSLGRIVTLNL